MDVKLPITAMVVGRNEAHFLERCFSSIFFCNEILYTDIQSIDGSKSIAKKYSAKIYDSEIIPSCEFAQAKMVHEARNEWVIFIDPDEFVDRELSNQIITLFPELEKMPDIGAVIVPWEFYFNNYKLKGTVWGKNKKYFLVNKQRFSFKPVVHYGRSLNQGFIHYEIQKADNINNVLHHDWMKNYRVFLNKHLRYLKNEGIDRFNAGHRISAKNLLLIPLREFNHSFFKKSGYKDGITGLLLSLFWSFYQTYANTNLFLLSKGILKKRI